MKCVKPLSKLAAAGALIAASASGYAATYSLTGIIDSCTGVCSIFTAVGQTASFGFDGADGAGPIDVGSISNVDISLSTPSGGSLAFVSGVALASSLQADGSNLLTGGTVTLRATGATTGIVAQADVDVSAGIWTAYVVSAADGSLAQIAGGTLTGGTIASPVPVPAAAWLFGSALVGLLGVRRRRI